MRMGENVRGKLNMLRIYMAVFLMTGMFLCLGMGAQAESKKWTDACKAYSDFLAKNVSVIGLHDYGMDTTESYEKTSGFQIIDLDKDGVPELVALHISGYKTQSLYIYTCKNNKVVLVEDAEGKKAVLDINYNAAGTYSLYICDRGHLHTIWSARYMGNLAMDANAYIMKNGKLESCMKGYRGYLDYNTRKFSINGETVSEEAYEAEIKKCEANKKGFLENTPADRASILPTGAGTDSGTGEKPNKASIKLNKTSIALNKGKSYTLKLSGTKKKPKWKSSNKSVATVSGNGKVTAKKAGTTKITATLNGKKYECKVTVKASSIKLNKTKLSLKVGAKSTLKLKGTNKKATWKSSKPSVAAVSKKGVVTAKKAGTATITAKAGGKTVKCTVTVKKAAKVESAWRSINFLEEKSVKVGKATFTCVRDTVYNQNKSWYTIVDGKEGLRLWAKDSSLSDMISTNGSEVIYYETEPGQKVFYKDSVYGGAREKIGTISSTYEFNFAGYCNGNLYYCMGFDPAKLYSYNIETGKTKVLLKDCGFFPYQYKDSFIFLPPEPQGQPTTWLYIYDTKTQKGGTVTEKWHSRYYVCAGNYLYYVEVTSDVPFGFSKRTIAVKRCKLNGTGKKMLVDNLEITSITDFTENSITYVDANGITKTRNF